MPKFYDPPKDYTLSLQVQRFLNETLQYINNQIIDGLTKYKARILNVQLRRRGEEDYDTGDGAEPVAVEAGDAEGAVVENLDDENVLKDYLRELVNDDNVYNHMLKGELTDEDTGTEDEEEPEEEEVPEEAEAPVAVEYRRRRMG
jgi:hypothetical protein